jgi:hypothetical protein
MTKRSHARFDELRPLVDPGWYDMRLVGWQTYLYLNRQPKVELNLSIVSMGPHFETTISRFFSVKALKGKAGNRGRVHVGRSSDLLRTYARLVDGPIGRLDRLPLSRLLPLLLRGKVETVTTDRLQKELPQSLWYSVVRDLELAPV